MERPQPADRPSRRKVLKWGAAALGGWGLYSFGIEPDWLEVTHTQVPIRGLGKGLDGFRIGVISDIHYPEWVGKGYIQRAFGLLMAEKPDLVAVPGDLYQRDTPIADRPLKGIFDQVSAPYGVFGSLGNHDLMNDTHLLLKTVADQTPIQMLTNASRIIERDGAAMALGGVPYLKFGPPIDLAKTFLGVPPDMPRIALCHHPDFAEAKRETERVDLLLAGHTHGGEVRLTPCYAPVTMSDYGSKFLGGLVDGSRYRVYTSRGIARPAHCRFLSRPEVTVLTLRSA